MPGWGIAQIFAFIESAKKFPIHITRKPKEKIRPRPISPILGREENGFSDMEGRSMIRGKAPQFTK